MSSCAAITAAVDIHRGLPAPAGSRPPLLQICGLLLFITIILSENNL